MSALIEKLRQASRPGVPLGFGAQARSKPAALVLVAELPRWEKAQVEETLAAGADALLLPGRDAPPPEAMRSALGPTPWGVRLERSDETTLRSLREAGCDFFLFSLEASAALLGQEGIGRILLVDPPWEEGWLRAASQLPVDALWPRASGGQREEVLVLHLFHYQRLSAAAKPILIEPPLGAGPTELRLLRDAGVQGLAVSGEGLASRLSTLREAIGKLPPSFPGRERRAALLPLTPRFPSAVESEEEEP